MDQIDQLESHAVEAAIALHWNKAIELNLAILKIDNKHIQSLLRLGFAYLQTSQYELARKYYKKVLRLQSKNTVAQQYMERIEILEKTNTKPQTDQPTFDPHLFIESLGKTKTVALTNLGQKQILAHLFIGQQISLKIKKRRVEVRTDKDEYIGALPDDLSKRLILFIKAKSSYSAYIKEATLTRVIVFIREEKKGRSVHTHISFPLNMQKNIDQLANNEPAEQSEDHEEEVEYNDWEKLAAEVSEEKEEALAIQTEDLDEDEEE